MRRDAWATLRVPKLALELFRCLFLLLLLVGFETDELSPRSSPPTVAMVSFFLVRGQKITFGIANCIATRVDLMLIDANWNRWSCQEQQDFPISYLQSTSVPLWLHEAALTRPPVFIPCYQLGGWGGRQDEARTKQRLELQELGKATRPTLQ